MIYGLDTPTRSHALLSKEFQRFAQLSGACTVCVKIKRLGNLNWIVYYRIK